MITPTKDDVGRRVRLPKWPGQLWRLASIEPCGAEGCNCCSVKYDKSKHPIATQRGHLEWADEELL